MIDLLRKNIDKEIEILREISIFLKRMELANPAERALLSESVDALRNRMAETNDLTISILKKVQLPEKSEKRKDLAEIPPKEKFAGTAAENQMLLSIDRKKILQELDITENILKKIKKKKAVEKFKEEGFEEARGYLKLSNKYFLRSSSNLIKKGYFSSLPSELKKSNLNILFETYVAAMLFSAFISFFAALFLLIFFLFFEVSFSWPIISSYTGSFAARLLKFIWLPLIIPIGTLLVFYFYPSVERKSIGNRINEELPFAVIHMNSISGSGIEPTEIFKIIAMSKEYPYLRKEIRKVLNQTNIYGYDLVTSLNNVSKGTSSSKLAELFAGLATTINSGGDLSEFFEKRSETLLIGYRFDKEKAIKIAETAMDIYISVVIAAPMILMLMLVMISVSGIQIGFTPYELTLLTIGGVALINIVFLTYLQTNKNLY